MDRLGTCEIPRASTRKCAGNWAAGCPNALARTGPPTIRERRQGEHEERRVARTPEAKQISDRGCAGGKS